GCGGGSPSKSEPVARTGAGPAGAIGRIREFAFVDRQTSATDALGQPSLEPLKLGNPLIDPFGPLAREAGPVLSRRHPIGRKLGELRADLIERQPDALREDDE